MFNDCVPQGWCQIWNFLYVASQYTSILLVVGFTVERFISVCRPFSCEKLSKNTRSPKVIAGIIFASLSFASPHLYIWDVWTDKCMIRQTFLNGTSDFYEIWNWTSNLVMFGAFPVVVLVLNICVLRQIHLARSLYMGSDTLHRHVANSKFTPTSATLMWISFYLILCKLPVTVMMCLENIIVFGQDMSLEDMSNDGTWQKYFSYYTARKMIDEMSISHHACNIFIYAATSKQFRKYLRIFVQQFQFCRKCRTSSGFTSRSHRPHGWTYRGAI